MAILLCMDDTLVAMPESLLSAKTAIEKRFACRERMFLPSDFQGVDFFRDGADTVLSQMAYLHMKGRDNAAFDPVTKVDLHRTFTEDEIRQHRTASVRLSWVGTSTSPTFACLASMALQGAKKTVALLCSCHEAYVLISHGNLASLRYVPLNFDTIHIRLFSDGSFQNLPDKHSQIGFVFILADGNEKSNIIHWHSSRATRRPASTEDSELMALDVASLRLRNQRRIIFQLLHKEVPVVAYIDNQTLWQNLINSTAPSMPEIMYRCREMISDEIINRICLIESKQNPADAMIKKNPDASLFHVIKKNEHTVHVKRVFMLQHSLYRHESVIPTSSVPMTENLTKGRLPTDTFTPS